MHEESFSPALEFLTVVRLLVVLEAPDHMRDVQGKFAEIGGCSELEENVELL